MKREATLQQRSGVKILAKVGVLSAVAAVLMIMEFPLWFVPSFYKLDISEIPVLLGAFAMGPLAAAAIELIKVLLSFILNGTTTAGVGELANFLIGCALVVPAAVIYRNNKTYKGALLGLLVGIVIMSTIGSLMNYYVLLPTFSKFYGMPVQSFVDMGHAVNPFITDMKTLVLFGVVPFNVLKGILVSALTLLMYKKVSPILHK